MSSGDGMNGLVVNLTPKQVCWFVDNTSLNGSDPALATNNGKNDNQMSPNTVRSIAEAFIPGVRVGTSTKMILCPADSDMGNAELFAQAYMKASSHAEGDKQVSCEWCSCEKCVFSDFPGWVCARYHNLASRGACAR